MAIDCDVLIYGGTAAGVTAAIAAAGDGKRVLLVEPGRHLGGMTSGGLGWTDFGNQAAVGGLARRFYIRVGDHYEQTLGTRQFTEQGSKGGATDGACFVFEPGAAETVLESMLREAGDGVRVMREHRLAGVEMEDDRIARFHLDSAPAGAFNEPGDEVTGRVTVTPRFCLDCSYEGDLLAAAGCSFHLGREGNAVYGETLNGIPAETHKHQLDAPVDPWVTPGDPSSGLLPYVSDEPLGEPGAGDRCVQAYNFRLCLTERDDLKLPIGRPDDYDPAEYELLRRFLRSTDERDGRASLRRNLKIDPLPNGKTDINNNGGVSTDFIGQNHAYPEADFATRGKIWRAHLRWIHGLLHTLAEDGLPKPEQIRDPMRRLGLCRDEFTDTQGWPHQLYVREARRLLGRDVMTEHHCLRKTVVDDPIGLAAYQMDSHNCRRLVIDGAVKNEGDVQVPPTGPYPIGYGAMVPRDGARNLLVPVCCSASHIAFGSIRMEPVFMVLGESAARAACLCLDHDLAAGDLPYDRLRGRLVEAGQVLAWAA
jgi:hypothetical protein